MRIRHRVKKMKNYKYVISHFCNDMLKKRLLTWLEFLKHFLNHHLNLCITVIETNHQKIILAKLNHFSCNLLFGLSFDAMGDCSFFSDSKQTFVN